MVEVKSTPTPPPAPEPAMCRADVGGVPCGEQEPCGEHPSPARDAEPTLIERIEAECSVLDMRRREDDCAWNALENIRDVCRSARGAR